jgi:hypothetical protein
VLCAPRRLPHWVCHLNEINNREEVGRATDLEDTALHSDPFIL